MFCFSVQRRNKAPIRCMPGCSLGRDVFVSSSDHTQEMWQKLFLPLPLPDFRFLTSKPFQLGQSQFNSSVAHIFLLPTGLQIIHSHFPWSFCVQGWVQYFSAPTPPWKKNQPYNFLWSSSNIYFHYKWDKYKSNAKLWAVSITSGERPLSNFT